jgi:hypothetical protein
VKWQRVHFWLAVIWAVLFIPSVLLWKKSVPFLVFVSVYANFIGHVSSWQAARVETKVAKQKKADGA